MFEIKDKKCVIFDMDGCLVDTESVYCEIWEHLFQIYNISINREEIEKWQGLGWARIKNRMLEINSSLDPDSIRVEREKIFFSKLEVGDVSAKPFAREILEKLKLNGYTLLLGSSTYREKGTLILDHFQFTNYFDYLVFGDDVEQTKPMPDIFEKCHELSGYTKDETLIFEDSYNGIKAANSAGIDVVYVPDIHFNDFNDVHYLAHIESFNEVSL